MAEVLFRAKLLRDDAATPWGFRLQGGADYDRPLTLLKVVENSIAAKSGLHAGDIVVKLAGYPGGELTHSDAQQAIYEAGNQLEIIVERAEEESFLPPPKKLVDSKDVKTEKPAKRSKEKDSSPEKSPPQPPQEDRSKSKAKSAHTKSAGTQPHPSRAPPPVPDASPAKPPAKQEPEKIKNAQPNITKQVESLPAPTRSPRTARSTAMAKPATEISQTAAKKSPEAQRSNKTTHPTNTPRLPRFDDIPDLSVLPTMDAVLPPGMKRIPLFDDDDDDGPKLNHIPSITILNSKFKQPPEIQPEPKEKEVSENKPQQVVLVVKQPPQQEKTESIRKEIPVEDKRLAARMKDLNVLEETAKLGNSYRSNENGTETVETNEPVVTKNNHRYRFKKRITTEESEPPQEQISERIPEAVISNIKKAEDVSLKEVGGLAGGTVTQDIPEESHQRLDDSIATRLYPWRYKKGHTGDFKPGDVEMSAMLEEMWKRTAAEKEIAPPLDLYIEEVPAVKPSLKLVGKRIENTSIPGSGHMHQDAIGGRESPTRAYHQHQQAWMPPIKVLPMDARGTTEHTRYQGKNATIDEKTGNIKLYVPPKENIYFSAESPALVDIPIPAVKEMVEDLNRRLEAIAAQQPGIAEPPTAQEIGLSFLKSHLEKQQAKQPEEEREIFIDTKPSDLSLDNYIKLIGSEANVDHNLLYKIYDVRNSPLSSPGVLRAQSGTSSQLSPSGRIPGRRVHFAEPVEQSVIEIEPRTSSRRPRRRDPRDYLPLTASDSSYSSTTSSSASSISAVPSSVQPSPASSSSAVIPPQTEHTEITTPPQVLPVFISQADGGQLQPTNSSPPIERQVRQRAVSPPPPPVVDIPVQSVSTAVIPQPSSPSGPSGISVTIRKGGEGSATVFTLPPGQVGRPTHFRYTISSQPQQTRQPQSLPPQGSMDYSFPPSYEESQRKRFMQTGRTSPQKSWDDSVLDRPPYRTSALVSQYLKTAAGPQSPPMRSRRHEFEEPPHIDTGYYHPPPAEYVSPQSHSDLLYGTPQKTRQQGYGFSAQGGLPPQADTVQSKSFKALEAQLLEGGKARSPDPRVIVEILGQPSQVLQPAAVGRPFVPTSPTLDEEIGGRGSPLRLSPAALSPSPEFADVPPIVLNPEAYGYQAFQPFPGVFALLDSSFMEKFQQWHGQQRSRSHFQSETQKLVQELDKQRRLGGHQ